MFGCEAAVAAAKMSDVWRGRLEGAESAVDKIDGRRRSARD